MKRREVCSSLLLLLVAALCTTAVRAQLAGEDARSRVGHYDVQLEPRTARHVSASPQGISSLSPCPVSGRGGAEP
jgi:hypothetical protein